MQVNLIYNSKLITISSRGKQEIKYLGDRSLKQGGNFSLTCGVNGDYSSWIPKAQIRNDYLGNGELLASFEFDLTYDANEDSTKIIMFIKGGITKLLPVTEFQALTNQSPSKSNCLLYDVELIDPNDSQNIVKVIESSFIQVKPEVTDESV